MKKSFCILLAVFSFNVLAQSQNMDQLINDKLERLQRASGTGDLKRLSRQEKEIVNSGLSAALSVVPLDDRRPGQGQGYGQGQGQGQSQGYGQGPSQGQGQGPINNTNNSGYGNAYGGNGNDWRRSASFERNKVLAFESNNCSVSQITEIRANDRCDRLEGIFRNRYVGSVLINDECAPTQSISFKTVCPDLVLLAESQRPKAVDLEAYTQNNCSIASKLTTIDSGVNCEALGGILKRNYVTSIKVDNKCILANAFFTADVCHKYQDAVYSLYEQDGVRRRGDSAELFTSNNCTSGGLVSLRRGDDCQALGGLFNGLFVRSVKFRGQCVSNVSNFEKTCETFVR